MLGLRYGMLVAGGLVSSGEILGLVNAFGLSHYGWKQRLVVLEACIIRLKYGTTLPAMNASQMHPRPSNGP